MDLSSDSRIDRPIITILTCTPVQVIEVNLTDHPRVKTVGNLKNYLQKTLGLTKQQQKLMLRQVNSNGITCNYRQHILQNDRQLLKDLNLAPSSRFVLMTHNDYPLTKYPVCQSYSPKQRISNSGKTMHEDSSTASIQNITQSTICQTLNHTFDSQRQQKTHKDDRKYECTSRELHRLKTTKVNKPDKLLNMSNIFQQLNQKQKKIIIDELFPNNYALDNHIYIQNEDYFQFLLTKMTQDRFQLQKLLLSEQQYLLRRFIGACEKQKLAQPKPTIPPVLYTQLISLKYSESETQKALYVGQNDPQRVLTILQEGYDKYLFTIPHNIPQDKQQFFLYQWFFKPQHKIVRLKVAFEEPAFSIFRNSLKIRCPPLYHLIQGQGKYMKKLIGSYFTRQGLL